MATGIKHVDTGASLDKTEMEGADLHEITADLDVDTHKVVNVVDPTADQHAATKKYHDDNVRGFSSRCRAYRDTSAQTVPSNTEGMVYLNAESYDGLGEFDSSAKTGAADATEANKLHDADGGFAAGDVGKWVWNTTDNTYAKVSAFVDSGELTLSADIMVNGENYTLYSAAFTATVAGYYLVHGALYIGTPVVNHRYAANLYKNGVNIIYGGVHASYVGGIFAIATEILHLDVGDYIQLGFWHDGGAPVAVNNASEGTYLAIHRLS